MSCVLTSSFITLTGITIAIHRIVHLNINTACSGGTRTRISWNNFKSILGMLLNRNSDVSLYVSTGKSCMKSDMEEKVTFHLLIYAKVCS